jgi:WD40 repeat protein
MTGRRSLADADADLLSHYVAAVLAPTGNYARIRQLVTSADYLAAKAAKVGTRAMVEDVRAARRLAPDQDAASQLSVLETALTQSARLVIDDLGQLYGQLLARVPRGVAADLDRLLDDAAGWRGGTWLRPLSKLQGRLYLRSFGPTTGFVDAVAISDDATVVLAGDRAGGLFAWNTDSGEQIWAGNAGAAVDAVAFQPGSFEAIVAAGATVARWSLADRRLRPFAPDPGRNVTALATDGRMVVYGAGSRVHAYDLAANAPTWLGERHRDQVAGVAILDDRERCVSVSSDGHLIVCRLDDGAFVTEIGLPADQPLCLTAVRARPTVVLGTRNRRVIVVDLDTAAVTILRGHTNQVRSVAALPNGEVLSGSYDGQMLAWDLTNHEYRRVGVHDRWCLSVASPRRPGPLVSGCDDGIVRVWDASFRDVPPARKNKLDVRALVVGAGTAYAAVDRTVTRLDLATVTAQPPFTGHRSPVVALAWSSHGTLASGSYDKDIRLWDLSSGESTVLKGHTNGADALTLTPDGMELISVSRDATWRRWNLVAGTAGPTVRGAEPFNEAVTVSPDGARVITTTREHNVEVWDRLTGLRVLPPLYGHAGYVNCLAVTPDCRRLLTGSWDHSLRVWDLSTGAQEVSFDHPAWVTDLVLTADGRLAVTACSDGTIRVFDLDALNEREPFAGHPRGVWHLALAADEMTLFSVGSDQTVRAWNFADRAQIAVFEAETSLQQLALAATDLIVVGTSKGAVVPFRLEHDGRQPPGVRT